MIMASYMCVYCLMDVVFFSQVGFTSAPGFIKVISFPEFSRMHESHVVSLSSLNRVGILGPLSWNCSFDCLQLVLNRIYRILGYSFVNVFFVCKRIFEYLLCNELLLLITIVSVHVTCARCIAHAWWHQMRVVDRSVSIREVIHVEEGINAVFSACCATKPLSTAVGLRSTTVGLQRLYCEVCL